MSPKARRRGGRRTRSRKPPERLPPELLIPVGRALAAAGNYRTLLNMVLMCRKVHALLLPELLRDLDLSLQRNRWTPQSMAAFFAGSADRYRHVKSLICGSRDVLQTDSDGGFLCYVAKHLVEIVQHALQLERVELYASTADEHLSEIYDSFCGSQSLLDLKIVVSAAAHPFICSIRRFPPRLRKLEIYALDCAVPSQFYESLSLMDSLEDFQCNFEMPALSLLSDRLASTITGFRVPSDLLKPLLDHPGVKPDHITSLDIPLTSLLEGIEEEDRVIEAKQVDMLKLLASRCTSLRELVIDYLHIRTLSWLEEIPTSWKSIVAWNPTVRTRDDNQAIRRLVEASNLEEVRFDFDSEEELERLADAEALEAWKTLPIFRLNSNTGSP